MIKSTYRNLRSLEILAIKKARNMELEDVVVHGLEMLKNAQQLQAVLLIGNINTKQCCC